MSTSAPAKPIRDNTRLSQADEALILKLAADGRKQTEIAQLVGCSQPTVSTTLKAFSDTRLLAKRRLNNSALALSERIIKHANVEESLEVLDRLDVIAKRDRSPNPAGNVQVVVNMPGQTKYRAEMIDLSPVPQGQLAEKSTG